MHHLLWHGLANINSLPLGGNAGMREARRGLEPADVFLHSFPLDDVCRWFLVTIRPLFCSPDITVCFYCVNIINT